MNERSRYTFRELGGEGLLLDFSSGSLFHLNESATLVWARWLGGSSVDGVADALAQRYRLSIGTAREHVLSALELKKSGAQTSLPLPTPFAYERSPDGYTLSSGGVPLLLVDESGDSLRLCGPGACSARDVLVFVQVVAPKLMALRGHLVLHASAVALGNRVVAFCGSSGAGKTSTARALVRGGAAPVCEDKLVIRSVSDGVEASVTGERRIAEWAGIAADELARGRTVDCAQLDAAMQPLESLPLHEIGFLDVSRRAGSAIVARPMSVAEGASAIFAHSFYGSDAIDDWKRGLASAVEGARTLTGYELAMPAGLPALQTAAAELVRRGSLRSI